METDHGAVFEREVVRELVAEVGGDGVVPREGAVVRGRGGEDDLRAELGGWRETACTRGDE